MDEEPQTRQLSATTHWTVHPLTEQQQERWRRTNRLKTKLWIGQGAVFTVGGLVALLWLLTSHTVTATLTHCGAPYTHHRHVLTDCRLTWADRERVQSKAETVAAPAHLGSKERLSLGGLGTSTRLAEKDAELIVGMLLAVGGSFLVLGLLFLRYDIRSGRSGPQLGR